MKTNYIFLIINHNITITYNVKRLLKSSEIVSIVVKSIDF